LTDDIAISKDMVPLKFQPMMQHDDMLIIVKRRRIDSWFALRIQEITACDTEYTFSLTDLSVGAYKWRIECLDKDKNKATSEEREFTVIDANAPSITCDSR